MNPRVEDVKPTDDYKLELVFANGIMAWEIRARQ